MWTAFCTMRFSLSLNDNFSVTKMCKEGKILHEILKGHSIDTGYNLNLFLRTNYFFELSWKSNCLYINLRDFMRIIGLAINFVLCPLTVNDSWISSSSGRHFTLAINGNNLPTTFLRGTYLALNGTWYMWYVFISVITNTIINRTAFLSEMDR